MTEVCHTRQQVGQLPAKHIILTAGSAEVETPAGLDVPLLLVWAHNNFSSFVEKKTTAELLCR